jgi:hypothetical protein
MGDNAAIAAKPYHFRATLRSEQSHPRHTLNTWEQIYKKEAIAGTEAVDKSSKVKLKSFSRHLDHLISAALSSFATR